MTDQFDIERYLDNSRKVDVMDLHFESAADFSITAEEFRCLTYMMDIEAHTMMYLRALLRTCAVRDPEVMSFLHCWVYEEFFHGRAIRQFLEATGFRVDAFRADRVQRTRTWREWTEEWGSAMLCSVLKDFAAVYFTWGAIQELTTLEAYQILARRTQNPILRELLPRLAKDERRHFSFYFNKARPLLKSTTAQRLTAWALQRFWTPVGQGVKESPEVQWTMKFIFDGAEGLAAAQRIDAIVSRLPGLEKLCLLKETRERAVRESTDRLWYYVPSHEHRRSG